MCLFCQIVNNEIPAYRLYEDDDVLVILDIGQATKGHSLIIPKQHYSNLLEVPADLRHKLIDTAVNISSLLQEKLAAGGCNILTNINEVAGQTIMHAHLHILPRYPDDDLSIKFNQHPVDLASLIAQIND